MKLGKKMKDTAFIVLLALATQCGCAKSETGLDDLVTVKVKGTSIDMVPTYIDVVVADPEASANELIQRGGTKATVRQIEEGNRKVPNTVSLRGSVYIFVTPAEWKATTNADFEIGDVVYTFHVDSNAQRDHLVQKHHLTKHLEIQRKNEQTGRPLYMASPKYYVVVYAKTTKFTCAMWCTEVIVSDPEQQCPICFMDLFPIEAYG